MDLWIGRDIFLWLKSGKAYFFQVDDIRRNLDETLADYANGNYQTLMEAVAPNCSALVLECSVAGEEMDGAACCGSLFNPKPIINQYG